MITDESDRAFKQRLTRVERAFASLLADPHYGPLMHEDGRPEFLADLRQEWRERQERARTDKVQDLREEASLAES
ncbi:hypothetical protein [Curtobacterium caseinilyticum]|uniref:Uncharacterized protein n=1 Tax=Curtobacterium caseinilyticum TaxID=3055137 RepID=A0ABT7TU84_9MICO|nr:hypothetical protein [Curtobacterium caseinilyticum]MDM7893148.1 hypothetical protein [Curtobacterium caseinilyticum]